MELPGEHRENGLEHAARRTTIVSKAKDAPWIPPKSVREEHEKRGEPLPAVVPGGPDNPMGRYKMALGIPGGAYLIHGTNRPAGIGMQVTHGCMRLYPEDIETLYGMVPVGTQVTIVNQPYKWGWVDGELLIEVHPPLQEDAVQAPTLTDLTRTHRRRDTLEAARDRLDRRRAHLARGARHPDAGLGRGVAHRFARNRG